MHILFLSDNFFPESNAPANRTYENAKEWVRNGHKVTVITCVPNFPKGKVHEGYKNKIWQSEVVDGINVIRIWSFIAANEGFAKRIIDYLSYMISSFIGSFFVRNFDVVIATSPQFFTAVSGYFVSRFRRKPFIFELRDLWPESIQAVGVLKNGLLLRNLEKLELFLYNKSDMVIAVTDSFKKNLLARGVKEEKIHVIFNGVNTKEFCPIHKDPTLLSRLDLFDKYIVGYIGTHGMAHELYTVLVAAKNIQENYPTKNIYFLFVGEGAEKRNLVEHSNKLGLKNIIFLNAVSRSEVAKYWSLLDASIIHLKKTDEFKSVIPSKIFECMAMGIPLIHGVEGESAKIVAQFGIGFCFEPQNAKDLSSKILQLYECPQLANQFSQNGPESAKYYDRKLLAGKMLELIMKVYDKNKEA